MEIRDVAPLEGYEPQYGLLLATLQNATRAWRYELEDVPDEAVVWQAYPDGHSIGGVLLHMADAEAFWLRQTALGIPIEDEEKRELLTDDLDQYEFRWPTPPAKPLGWYYGVQDRIRARTLEDAREYPAPDEKVLTWNGTYSTYRRLIAHVTQHESYSGGQLVLLKALWERQPSE
jgi:uncharacterized damage-inducible protein DinB